MHKWEDISNHCERMEVPGGWLYRVWSVGETGDCLSCTFVPDGELHSRLAERITELQEENTKEVNRRRAAERQLEEERPTHAYIQNHTVSEAACILAEFSLKWLKVESPEGRTFEESWAGYLSGLRALLKGEELPHDIKKTLERSDAKTEANPTDKP